MMGTAAPVAAPDPMMGLLALVSDPKAVAGKLKEMKEAEDRLKAEQAKLDDKIMAAGKAGEKLAQKEKELASREGNLAAALEKMAKDEEALAKERVRLQVERDAQKDLARMLADRAAEMDARLVEVKKQEAASRSVEVRTGKKLAVADETLGEAVVLLEELTGVFARGTQLANALHGLADRVSKGRAHG
jgi:chromosome segregation ATPase